MTVMMLLVVTMMLATVTEPSTAACQEACHEHNDENHDKCNGPAC